MEEQNMNQRFRNKENRIVLRDVEDKKPKNGSKRRSYKFKGRKNHNREEKVNQEKLSQL